MTMTTVVVVAVVVIVIVIWYGNSVGITIEIGPPSPRRESINQSIVLYGAPLSDVQGRLTIE